MNNDINLEIEQKALREYGILGRSGPYGNGLYAFEYEILPPEAKQVIEVLSRSGPLLYPAHDGRLFGNRSGDLPGKCEYREFTVPTPGALNRGRRRLVISDNGLVFFTACHYDRVPGQAGSPQHTQAIAAIDEQWRNGFYVVTGMSMDQRERIAAAMKRIHNSRLPALIGSA
jgi:ribonuclease T1